jgi:hypothetical protein
MRPRCADCHIDNRKFDGSTGSHTHGRVPFGDAVVFNYRGQRYYPEGGADSVRKTLMLRAR